MVEYLCPYDKESVRKIQSLKRMRIVLIYNV